MKNLYIIGAGAFARELESWLSLDSSNFLSEYRLQGFLNSGSNDLDQYPCDLKLLGDWQDFPFASDDAVLLGTSDAKWKRKVVEKLYGRVSFPTYVHPSVVVGKYSHIGEGTIILLNSVVTCNVSIGRFVTINTGSQFGHDCKIGDFASVMANVDFGGWTSLGENSFVGTNATIIPRASVGKDVQIGAGSIVVRDVPDGSHMFGNPASRLLVPR